MENVFNLRQVIYLNWMARLFLISAFLLLLLSACQATNSEYGPDVTNPERSTILISKRLCEEQGKTFIFHGRGSKEGNMTIMGDGGPDKYFRATCR